MAAGVDFRDESFVDEEHLSQHRARTLWPTADRNGHPALMVASRGQYAAIDRELAELVYLLWQHGIETGQSCRADYGEDAYFTILFDDDVGLLQSLLPLELVDAWAGGTTTAHSSASPWATCRQRLRPSEERSSSMLGDVHLIDSGHDHGGPL